MFACHLTTQLLSHGLLSHKDPVLKHYGSLTRLAGGFVWWGRGSYPSVGVQSTYPTAPTVRADIYLFREWLKNNASFFFDNLLYLAYGNKEKTNTGWKFLNNYINKRKNKAIKRKINCTNLWKSESRCVCVKPEFMYGHVCYKLRNSLGAYGGIRVVRWSWWTGWRCVGVSTCDCVMWGYASSTVDRGVHWWDDGFKDICLFTISILAHVQGILHRAMLPLDIPRALWSPGAVEFLCDGHLVTELSVYFAGKVCATIRGYYAWYFPVSEREFGQTADSVYCTVPCAWYGSEVSTEAV